MTRRSDITVAADGVTPQPGVYVTVKNAGGALASITTDAGAVIAGSVIVSGLDGSFYYNAADGAYTEEYRLTSGGTVRKVLAVSLNSSTATVSTVSVVTANGVSGTVANPTTTPAITLALGAITPTSVAASGAVTGSNLSGTNTGDQTITLTGDVTGTGAGSFAATIAAQAVTNAKLANVSTATFKGRTTAGTGSPEDLTGTQATALLDVVTTTLKGLAPASGGGTTNFLRADGTWATPAGGGGTTTNALTINNGGAGVASGGTFNGSAAVTISYNSIGATRAGAITSGDLTIATARLAGRTTAATGAIEEISVGGNLSLSAGVLNTGATVALLASPTFTGTPAAPTAAVGTNTTQLATTAFVQGEKASAIQSVASASTVTPTFLNDQVNVTALAAPCQFLNPTGTPVEKGIAIRIKDNGTARALTYDTQYRAVGVTLPTTTVISKTLYLGMIYNSADTKWDVVSVAQEA